MPQPAPPTLTDRLTTNLLRVLPQHWLAAGMYRLMRSRTPWLKRRLIAQIASRYGVDMNDAVQPDLNAYENFNAFFTRALKADARPIAADSIVSPADGRISQMGVIEGDRLLQAKGQHYRLEDLLAGDLEAAAAFENGAFATIYLSPRDYHRVHLPYAGTLRSMVFVPGDLFSVSDATTQIVPRLFARNERVLCHFDTALGPLCVILVGAIFVGSMETVWHGEVRGPRDMPTRWTYDDRAENRYAAGAEIGRFNMGSTVIVLLPDGAATLLDSRAPGSAIRMGEALGTPR